MWIPPKDDERDYNPEIESLIERRIEECPDLPDERDFELFCEEENLKQINHAKRKSTTATGRKRLPTGI